MFSGSVFAVAAQIFVEIVYVALCEHIDDHAIFQGGLRAAGIHLIKPAALIVAIIDNELPGILPRLCRRALAQPPQRLEVEVANLLAQRIAVQAEDFRRFDLIAAGRGQRRRQQRRFEFAQHAVIEADRR